MDKSEPFKAERLIAELQASVTYQYMPMAVRQHLSDAATELALQAERIVRMRRALREIADDCEADYPPSHGAIKYAARLALENDQ